VTFIDLRSDTATRPTPGMREAIARAEVGDEQKREDPSVNELERRVADLVGQEEAVFLPTATMANQISLRILSEHGDELLADGWSHLFINELGGPAVHSGLVMRPLVSFDGRFTAEQVREAVWDRRDTHRPITRLVSIENTNNSAGGRIWPVEEIAAIREVCDELDLRLQMDGARLMNASVGSGVPADEIGRHFDAVTLCLSKGLGCPLGALVAGSAARMAKARRLKHLFGGAMRQAGIVAAAGVYALDNHIALLADDHARARRLAEGWHAAGLPVDLEQVETNFVQLDVEPLGLGKFDVIAALKEKGVGVSNTVHPTRLRALTHLDVSDEDIDRAIELAPEAVAAHV
jgi:threonine aldolase